MVALGYFLGGNQRFFLSPIEAVEIYNQEGRKGQKHIYNMYTKNCIFYPIVLIYLITTFGIRLVQLHVSKNYLFPL